MGRQGGRPEGRTGLQHAAQWDTCERRLAVRYGTSECATVRCTHPTLLYFYPYYDSQLEATLKESKILRQHEEYRQIINEQKKAAERKAKGQKTDSEEPEK